MLRFIITIAIMLILPAVVLAAGAETVRPELPGGTLLPGSGIAELRDAAVVVDAADASGEQGWTLRTSAWLQERFLSNIANTLIGWGAAIAVVALIFGAYQYFAAAGEADQISAAHKTIGWALGGIVVMMLSFSAVQIIVNVDVDTDDEIVCRPAYIADRLRAAPRDIDAIARQLSLECLAFDLESDLRACSPAYAYQIYAAADNKSHAGLLISAACSVQSLENMVQRGFFENFSEVTPLSQSALDNLALEASAMAVLSQ